MGKTLKEFLPSFGKWAWVVVVDYIFGFAGVYQSITGTTTLTRILWGIVFVFAFTIPPLIAFHKLRVSRDGVQKQLDAIRNARPNIELHGVENVTTKLRDVRTGEVLGEPCVTYALFANRPLAQIQAIDAPNVAGHIAIYDEHGNHLHGGMVGRWAETREEATGGLPTEMEQITLPANARPNPMDIILKYHQDQECYITTNAGRRRAPSDWRDNGSRLGVGSYFVRVRLRSSNVDKEFWFKLANNGKGTDVVVEVLSNAPLIVYKEGYEA